MNGSKGRAKQLIAKVKVGAKNLFTVLVQKKVLINITSILCVYQITYEMI